MRSVVWICIAVMLFAACSSSGSRGRDDGGSDDGDGNTQLDHDPEGSFLLVIPNELSLCSGFSEGRTWEIEDQMVGRIDLLAGQHVLERSEGDSTTDCPFSRVLFGPDRGPATISGDACLLKKDSIQVTTGDGTHKDWIFTLSMPMQYDGKQAEADLRILINWNHEAWPAKIDIREPDPDVTVSAEFRIAPGSDRLTEVQRFGLCDLPGPPTREIQALATNGDRVELIVHQGPWFDTCQASGETACLFLTFASLQLGDYTSDVENRLHLVYSGSHHNWHDSYLIHLDPPDGDVHALLAHAQVSYHPPQDPELVYLDVDLKELRRVAVSDWTDLKAP